MATWAYPSRKRRLLADLHSTTLPESSTLVHELANENAQWKRSQPRQVLLACREETVLYNPKFDCAPKTCKVVQKISDNAWIELNVPCDGPSLQEASNVIKQFATSYTNSESTSNSRSTSLETTPVRSIPDSSLIPDEEVLDPPMCSICMGPTESSHRHYGAHSCLSCRAFFRRSVQIEIYPYFTCNSNQKCVINPGNRSKCKLCRFEKCQQKGMRISAVLSEDQKRARFRKHLMLKRSKQMEMKTALRRFRKNNHTNA